LPILSHAVSVSPCSASTRCMVAFVSEVGDLLHRTHVLAITISHGEISAARAEHLFPEMWKRRGLSLGVDRYLFGRLLRQRG
jgi:hypothetical protein